MDRGKNCCLSVTSFSSHTIEVRGLKFGMHNPYMNASKVTNQIFDTLRRSRDIKVQRYVVNSGGNGSLGRV